MTPGSGIEPHIGLCIGSLLKILYVPPIAFSPQKSQWDDLPESSKN